MLLGTIVGYVVATINMNILTYIQQYINKAEDNVRVKQAHTKEE